MRSRVVLFVTWNVFNVRAFCMRRREAYFITFDNTEASDEFIYIYI